MRADCFGLEFPSDLDVGLELVAEEWERDDVDSVVARPGGEMQLSMRLYCSKEVCSCQGVVPLWSECRRAG